MLSLFDLHQPGIEPGNPAWKADMLPLHHWSIKSILITLYKKDGPCWD